MPIKEKLPPIAHEFTIDEAKWAHGKKHASYYEVHSHENNLLNEDGTMCCVGFFARSCGAKKKDLRHVSTIGVLSDHGNLTPKLQKLAITERVEAWGTAGREKKELDSLYDRNDVGGFGLPQRKKKGKNILDSSRGVRDDDTSITLREVNPVTVCIAAECEHDGSPCLVLCCDWQGTKGSFIRSDDVDKVREVGDATALLSGAYNAAEELVIACDQAVREFGTKKEYEAFDLDITTLMTALREAVRRRKAARANEFLGREFGLTYDIFLATGKTFFTEKQHDEILDDIRRTDLDATILFCFNSHSEPVITRVDRSGIVSWENNFSAIGTGGPIADAFLHQYEWDTWCSLEECLYRVYSAKVAAEKNPHVGPTTSLIVMTKGKRFDLSDAAWDQLEKKVKNTKVPKLTFDPGFLEERKGDEDDKEVQ